MNQEKTASRYEKARAELARERFYQCPECEPEAIAKHYAAHAIIAMQILQMIKCRQHTGGHPEIDRSIQMLVDEIKRNHLCDFGIPLEWSATPKPD